MRKWLVPIPIILLGACASSASPPSTTAPIAPPVAAPIAPIAKPAPVERPRTDCAIEGEMIFELHRQSTMADGPSFDIKVFASGAVTRDSTNGDAPVRPTTKTCASSAAMQAIRDHLAAPAWTVTPSTPCSPPPEISFYRTGTRTLLNDRGCDRLDANSRVHLDAILAVLGV